MNIANFETAIRNTFIDFIQGAEFVEEPIVFTRAEGRHYWDVDGKRFFDGIGGIFVASLGHRHPRLIEAVKKQMERITFGAPMHAITDVGIELGLRLRQVSPGNLNYSKTFSGGSESIEAALKLARQYQKTLGKMDKVKVISNYLSYHGSTYGALSAGGGHRKVKFEPHMPGFLKLPSPIQLRDKFPDWASACRFVAEMLDIVIQSEGPDTVGAYIVEPICNTGGIITPTREYFEIVRRTCDRHGVLLIYDEVLTGFGKTGNLFAAETFGVVPDILCSGKGMASGMLPSGSFMAREDIGDMFFSTRPDSFFFHGNTFAGFPLLAAVAMEVLDIIEEEKLCARAAANGLHMRKRLKELEALGIVREIRGEGSLLGIELAEDPARGVPFPADRKIGPLLKRTARNNGLIMRIDPDWFALSPALNATSEEIDELCDLVVKSVKEALDAVTAAK